APGAGARGRGGEGGARPACGAPAAPTPADADTTFFLSTTSQLADLRAPAEPVSFESDVEITGRLVDGDGKPVVGVLVTLRDATRRLGESTTDGRGGFALRVPASALGPGARSFTVVSASTTPWRRGTRAGPFDVQIQQPRPVPVSYTILAFAMTLGAALAYILLRTRPWRRLAEAWQRRRRKPETAAAVADADDSSPSPGLKLARPSLMQTLRRATDTAFTGRVCD